MPGNKRAMGSNLRKVDAHIIRPHEYEEAPELTDQQLASARIEIGGRSRGRPKLAAPKEAVKLRIDADVVAHFRATGPGWQTRINAALRRIGAREKLRA
jgi:uncharacterized protein (DUF4415 family)